MKGEGRNMLEKQIIEECPKCGRDRTTEFFTDRWVVTYCNHLKDKKPDDCNYWNAGFNI